MAEKIKTLEDFALLRDKDVKDLVRKFVLIEKYPGICEKFVNKDFYHHCLRFELQEKSSLVNLSEESIKVKIFGEFDEIELEKVEH